VIFTSASFVVFFAIVLAVYWRLPLRGQNIFLLVASYIFYGWIHPWFCILLAGSTILDYFVALGLGRFPGRRRLIVTASLVGNLGLLGVFKYYNFFAENVRAAFHVLGFDLPLPVLSVLLPVGISFYTFQSLGYTIDVYRGRCAARRNFIDFALYVSFFPQLVAGPIERATNLLPQVERPRSIDLTRIDSAVCLMAWGFFKKLVVADNLAIYVDRLYSYPALPFLMTFTAALGFTMQLFADFSAYTDIARGAARLMGLELMKNFDAPFTASNPVAFWQRWHISLSSWIRDYLFVSLPGSRSSRMRALANQLFAFAIFGLWHGASWNFIIWGVYNGLMVVVYSLWFRPWTRRLEGMAERLVRAGGVVLWFLGVILGALCFRQHDLGALLGYFSPACFHHTPEEIVIGLGWLAVILAFVSPMVVQYFLRRWMDRRWVRMTLLWLCLAGVVFLGSEGSVEFVYFAF